MLVDGVDNEWLIADCISGYSKAINIGRKSAEKEPLGLKYITANPFPPENSMCLLLAPHENKHPSKIGTRSGC